MANSGRRGGCQRSPPCMRRPSALAAFYFFNYWHAMLEKIISINVTVLLIVPIATTTVLKWRVRAGVAGFFTALDFGSVELVRR